ncbi:hypothetical protein [uncultured Parabacteroides sp.]|uniref:hypothetical protein n=1 Tax=uncultured Parabacteroides sp. TaxID=512312 RepID=UPI00280386C5|nr:hypothetical protein [uncultured Parabacteroides sp.]
MFGKIMNKILGGKHEPASDEGKRLLQNQESKGQSADPLVETCDDWKRRYKDLEKAYNEEKAKNEDYCRKHSELLDRNKELESIKEQYESQRKKGKKTKESLCREIESLQNELSLLKKESEKKEMAIRLLKIKNRISSRMNIHLKRRLAVYRSLHEGENDVFNTVLGIVRELENAFRATFEFTEPSLEVMARLFREEKANLVNMREEAKRMDEMLDVKRKNAERAQRRLKKEELKLESEKETVEKMYPQFKYLVRNRKSVMAQYHYLKKCEVKLRSKGSEKIMDDFEKLRSLQFKYDQRESRLKEKMKSLKREEKWLQSELAEMDRQKGRLMNENVEVQRQLYAEIEKNEQVLFIIRSLNSMNHLYEKITEELVASVRGEKTRRIVSSFLKGESIYEIAQKEEKSATSVQRMVLLAINASRKACR